MAVVITIMIASMTLFLLGLLQFWLNYADRSRLERVVVSGGGSRRLLTRWSGLDRMVLNSRWGSSIESAAAALPIRVGPGQLVAAGLGIGVVIGALLGSTLSWLMFPLGLILGYVAVRMYVSRERDKLREAFIAQMPELARTLSNASSAGLSVRTSIALAAEELDEPGRTEMRSVSEELNLGGSLDTALSTMERRLPSREVSILVSSLIVSSRTGGALVSALRDIADTLETRKELRREIRTTYAQTVATAYAVVGMGVFALFLLEQVNSGTVDAMLRSPLGQGALLIAGAIYAAGIWIVRRMTKVDI